MTPLRPHQKSAVAMIYEAWRSGARRPLLQMAVGGGKTITATELARPFIQRGERVCFVAPLQTLIEQTATVFRAQGFGPVGYLSGGYPAPKDDDLVIIASAQTISRRGPLPGVKLAIIDECHIRHDGVERWITGVDAPLTLALSATPWSMGLGRIYDRLIKPTSMRQLLDAGLLVPARVFAPSTFDTSKVRTVAGEFDQRHLAHAVDDQRLVGDVVSSWLRLGENRPTICFAVNLAHAHHIACQFSAKGVPTAIVEATTPADQREQVRQQLTTGAIKVVVNVGVLTAGFDLPAIGCIISAKPTKSETFHVQTLGRGLRPAPGKTDCIVIDHAGNTLRHGMVDDIDHHALDCGDGSRREKDVNPAVRRCATCARVKRHAERCNRCPPPSLPATAPGVLRQVLPTAATRQRAEQRAFLSGIRWIAAERGYAAGWPNVQFKARFGRWPDGVDARPAPPDDTTRAWFAGWLREARARLRRQA